MDKMNKAINVVFEAYKRHLEARLRILDEIIDAQIDEFQNMGMKFGEGLELSMKVLYPDREKMAGYAIQTALSNLRSPLIFSGVLWMVKNLPMKKEKKSEKKP